MMKNKVLCLILCLLIILSFSACACSSTDGDTEGKTTTTDGTEIQETDENANEIDVDLTALSSTMVYSEVYNMMSEPEGYIDKTVKMKGPFAVYHDENTDKYYYACIIQDATACCSQGLEFELDGDHRYPDDYPAEGEEITVTGTFDVYQEGENSYCVLRKAAMED